MIADGRRSSFHMIADDRRPYCDLRSAIIWKPALKVLALISLLNDREQLVQIQLETRRNYAKKI